MKTKQQIKKYSLCTIMLMTLLIINGITSAKADAISLEVGVGSDGEHNRRW